MTNPLKLAEGLSDDCVSFRCPCCWMVTSCCADPLSRRLIAAALRLAEEVHESCAAITMGGPRYHKFHGKRSPSVNVALDAYRAAKDGAP